MRVWEVTVVLFYMCKWVCAFCSLLLVRVWKVPVVLFYMCKCIGKGVCFLQFVISEGVGGSGCTVLYV